MESLGISHAFVHYNIGPNVRPGPGPTGLYPHANYSWTIIAFKVLIYSLVTLGLSVTLKEILCENNTMWILILCSSSLYDD